MMIKTVEIFERVQWCQSHGFKDFFAVQATSAGQHPRNSPILRNRYRPIWVFHNIPPNFKATYRQKNFIIEENKNIQKHPGGGVYFWVNFRPSKKLHHSRSPCWHRSSSIALRLRRPELCLSTSQQPTLYGIAASLASCCDCCLIDTCFAWSWRWLAIAASTLPPEMEGAGYDTSRTGSHKQLSWRPFSSTSSSFTCQPPSPQRMHMPRV